MIYTNVFGQRRGRGTINVIQAVDWRRVSNCAISRPIYKAVTGGGDLSKLVKNTRT